MLVELNQQDSINIKSAVTKEPFTFYIGASELGKITVSNEAVNTFTWERSRRDGVPGTQKTEYTLEAGTDDVIEWPQQFLQECQERRAERRLRREAARR